MSFSDMFSSLPANVKIAILVTLCGISVYYTDYRSTGAQQYPVAYYSKYKTELNYYEYSQQAGKAFKPMRRREHRAYIRSQLIQEFERTFAGMKVYDRDLYDKELREFTRNINKFINRATKAGAYKFPVITRKISVDFQMTQSREDKASYAELRETIIEYCKKIKQELGLQDIIRGIFVIFRTHQYNQDIERSNNDLAMLYKMESTLRENLLKEHYKKYGTYPPALALRNDRLREPEILLEKYEEIEEHLEPVFLGWSIKRDLITKQYIHDYKQLEESLKPLAAKRAQLITLENILSQLDQQNDDALKRRVCTVVSTFSPFSEPSQDYSIRFDE